MRISLPMIFVFYILMVLISVGFATLSDPQPEEIDLHYLNTAFHVLLGIWFCQERYPSAPKHEERADG